MTDIADGFDLVKSISVDNLLRQRDAMHERLHTVRATLSEIADIGKAAGIFETDSYHRTLDRAIYGEGSRYAYRTELQTAESIDAACKRIDAMAWDLLMRESGLWSLMDAKAREQWRENIDKVKVPPLNRDNIEATFQGLYGARADMFERGVLLCFRGLSWSYRTNLPQKFGKRIIKRVRHYGTVSQECMSELEDLQRVFCILDRRPEEDHRHGLYRRLAAAERVSDQPYGRRDRFEHADSFMTFRVFKNGNAAITFTRPDLVEKLNKIIAKRYPNALPAPK